MKGKNDKIITWKGFNCKEGAVMKNGNNEKDYQKMTGEEFLDMLEEEMAEDPFMKMLIDLANQFEMEDPNDYELNIYQKVKADRIIRKLIEMGEEVEVDCEPAWQCAYISTSFYTLTFNGREEVKELIDMVKDCSAVGIDAHDSGKVIFSLTVPDVYRHK